MSLRHLLRRRSTTAVSALLAVTDVTGAQASRKDDFGWERVKADSVSLVYIARSKLEYYVGKQVDAWSHTYYLRAPHRELVEYFDVN